jgi:hypothetical protein
VVLRPRKITAVLAGSLLGVSAIALGGGTAAADDVGPPGNNGTVKVDGVEFDDHPNNEPHVGCTFEVDFYGYDKGDLFADVEFLAWPPTQREGDNQVLLSDPGIFIGEDDNSGGGSQAGLDAHEEYTLDFTGIMPHPQQGFHVKLIVHADGSIGADTKYKVFWVNGCGETSTPTPSETPSESETPGGTTPPEETTAAAGELPRTGSGFPVGTAALLAIFLMAAGGVLLLTSRGVIKLPHHGVVRLPRGVTIRLPYRQKH